MTERAFNSGNFTMGFSRYRKITISSNGGPADQYTGWCSCREGGVVTIENTGSLVATWTLQRLGPDGVISDVTDNNGNVTKFTAAGTYSVNPQLISSQYRVNCKSGAYTSGSGSAMIDGR